MTFFHSWLWKMAWRDSRAHLKRLFLFVASIILGVAAMVAIGGFGDNLESAINDQAKTLLGADLAFRSQSPFPEKIEALADSIGGEQAREIDFSSMAFFPAQNATRLVRIRTLEGRFPFYGKLESQPAGADGFLRQHSGGALVDQNLMLQYGLALGDTVRLGSAAFEIKGELKKIPGQAEAGSAIAPTIYIAARDLGNTGLIRFGSRAVYRLYFRLAESQDPEKIREELDPQLRAERIRASTVESQKESLGQAMGNLYRFLNLVAFIALLLGGIGVGSAIHVYIKQKLNTIAVLRCVGATIRQTFLIYLIQTFAMGVAGALAGIALGLMIQQFIPAVVGDFLVVDLEMFISPAAVLQGAGMGLVLTLLFALLPLLGIRRVSPLLAIRASFAENSDRDPLRLGVIGLIAAAVVAFAILQTQSVAVGLGFALGLAGALALLTGAANLLMWGVKRFFPGRLGYLFRQSLANLYRPNNQTLVLMLSLGLGTFLIATLYVAQEGLLNQVALTGSGNQPNLILFDIQTDQNTAVREMVEEHQMPVLQNVPIVTARLSRIKDRSVTEMLADSSQSPGRWALNREFRLTYRDTLIETEKLVAGTWVPEVAADQDTIPVSIEDGLAEDLGIAVGDFLEIDVQGVAMPARIASIRDVDWQRVQTNFLIVFPRGVLEYAPQFMVVVTRAPSREVSATLQRDLVQRFPNVAAVDLALILRTVEGILDRISAVIRFMAFFSILTGLVVLASAVITSRYQRVQESVLLRTLGATKSQIRIIMLLEYVYLGSLAAATGVLLSLASGWALAAWVFNIAYHPPLVAVGAFTGGVILLTTVLGMLNSRGIATRPPLEILRSEA
ncbi:MAG TPA: ABC transporter permease [Calditrichia bacterium]|nr:ABC transporter permease [Calditrichota bacterium]HQV30805.1 ABC transporter permease [Calditrichia bacterium]